jgi:hypothetical protein
MIRNQKKKSFIFVSLFFPSSPPPPSTTTTNFTNFLRNLICLSIFFANNLGLMNSLYLGIEIKAFRNLDKKNDSSLCISTVFVKEINKTGVYWSEPNCLFKIWGDG